MVRAETTNRRARINTSSIQHLIAEEVANTRHPSLIEQPRLDGGPVATLAAQHVVELFSRQRHRVRPEIAEVGIDLKARETTRIVHDEFSAVGEFESTANPLRFIFMGPIEEAFDARVPIEQQHTRHAESNAERRTCRFEHQ